MIKIIIGFLLLIPFLWSLNNIEYILRESAVLLSSHLPTPTSIPVSSTPEITETVEASLTPTFEPTAIPTSIYSSFELPRFFSPSIHYWKEHIYYWADQSQIDPLLIATIMQIESCGNPRAFSSAGALGLMQVMPNWFDFDSGDNPWDPNTNMAVGLLDFSQCFERSDGNVANAFACYNGGNLIETPVSDYPRETQHYHFLSTRLYSDAKENKNASKVYNSWYKLRGRSMCKSAEETLRLSASSDVVCPECTMAEEALVSEGEYVVTDALLNVRDNPRLSASIIGEIPQGTIFRAVDEVYDEQGMRWIRHADIPGAWSALVSNVQPTSFREISIGRPIFVSAPVDLWDIDWVQPFGDTIFSRQYGHNHNYDEYSQGWHGGLDFGINEDRSGISVPVYAGLIGTVERVTSDSVWLRHGSYQIGYQHLESIPRRLQVGDNVDPWEYLGAISRTAFPRDNIHVHIEVRMHNKYLVNPAQIMPQVPWEWFDSQGYAEDATHQNPDQQPLIRINNR